MSSFSDHLHLHEVEGRLLGIWAEFASRVAAEDRRGVTPAHSHQANFKGDRATRSRWVNGKALPRCRACVIALAEMLKDDALLEAWDQESARRHDQILLRNTLSQLATLPRPLQRKVQERLRIDLQQSEFATREALRIGVRIAALTPTVHRGEASVRWRGELPPRARIRLAANQADLMKAYADESCVYRDLLHLDSEELAAGYAQLHEHGDGDALTELSYKAAGERAWTTVGVTSSPSPGCFEFDNDRAEGVDIQLRVKFPLPTRYACYPIQFGSYRVRDVAIASLKLAEDVSAEPPKLLVLPPDCPAFVDYDRGSVSLELGEQDSLLPTDATIFFYWVAAPVT